MVTRRGTKWGRGMNVLRQQRDAIRHPITLSRAVRDAVSRNQSKRLRTRLSAWFRYHQSRIQYEQLSNGQHSDKEIVPYPCIWDASASTPVEPVYYYQDSWAFERIIADTPTSHVDVGSHHKFVVFLSKLMDVTTIDIRRPDVLAESVRFLEGTILDLPFDDQSLSSISSLCVIEHIGLGRYGDPLDPSGTEKALAELMRVTAPGGSLYISVPIDCADRVYFNAHRAYRDETWRRLVSDFDMVDARYIVGKELQKHPGNGFGTACYHLRRPV